MARCPTGRGFAPLGSERRTRNCPRNDRPDPSRWYYGAARPPPRRRDVTLPPRPHCVGGCGCGGPRGLDSPQWPCPSGRAALVANGRRHRCRSLRRARDHGQRRDGIRAALGWSGHPATRARSHRHGLRTRSCHRGVRDRTGRSRALPLASPQRATGHCSRRYRAARCSRRADGRSARFSIGMHCRGGSSSSTSRLLQRSGR